jgi:hypothetical protein
MEDPRPHSYDESWSLIKKVKLTTACLFLYRYQNALEVIGENTLSSAYVEREIIFFLVLL